MFKRTNEKKKDKQTKQIVEDEVGNYMDSLHGVLAVNIASLAGYPFRKPFTSSSIATYIRHCCSLYLLTERVINWPI